MSGEMQLILGSLTREELDDANRFVGFLSRAWTTQSKDQARKVGLDTDGPYHLLTALRLAVLGEMTQRGGGEAWYPGMPTAGHVGERLLELYARRYTLRAQEAAMSRTGVVERACVVCGERKPQDHDHFERHEGLWADTCRDCAHEVDPERYRDAIAFSPPPAATAPTNGRHRTADPEEAAALL